MQTAQPQVNADIQVGDRVVITYIGLHAQYIQAEYRGVVKRIDTSLPHTCYLVDVDGQSHYYCEDTYQVRKETEERTRHE